MKKITLLLSLLMIGGCAGMPTTPNGFQMREAQTEHFSLPVWEKAPLESGKVIRFYITDNGNPTPEKPTALKLAAKDSFKNIDDYDAAARLFHDLVNMRPINCAAIKKYTALPNITPKLLKKLKKLSLIIFKNITPKALSLWLTAAQRRLHLPSDRA